LPIALSRPALRLAAAVLCLPAAATADCELVNGSDAPWFLRVMDGSNGKVTIMRGSEPYRSLRAKGGQVTLHPARLRRLAFAAASAGGNAYEIRMRLSRSATTDAMDDILLVARTGQPLAFLETPAGNPAPVILGVEANRPYLHIPGDDKASVAADRATAAVATTHALVNFSADTWRLELLEGSQGRVKVQAKLKTVQTLQSAGAHVDLPGNGACDLLLLPAEAGGQEYSIRMQLSCKDSRVQLLAKAGQPLKLLKDANGRSGPVSLGAITESIHIGEGRKPSAQAAAPAAGVADGKAGGKPEPGHHVANHGDTDWILAILEGSRGKVTVQSFSSPARTLQVQGDARLIPAKRSYPLVFAPAEGSTDYEVRMQLSCGSRSVRVVARPGRGLAFIGSGEGGGPVSLGTSLRNIHIDRKPKVPAALGGPKETKADPAPAPARPVAGDAYFIENATAFNWYLEIMEGSSGKVTVERLWKDPETLRRAKDATLLAPNLVKDRHVALKFAPAVEGGKDYEIRMDLWSVQGGVQLVAKSGQPLRIVKVPAGGGAPVALSDLHPFIRIHGSQDPAAPAPVPAGDGKAEPSRKAGAAPELPVASTGRRNLS
jgi:hypothetical protein